MGNQSREKASTDTCTTRKVAAKLNHAASSCGASPVHFECCSSGRGSGPMKDSAVRAQLSQIIFVGMSVVLNSEPFSLDYR